MRRLVSATLLLYPRSVRRRHGSELTSLVEELIERDGASRPRVITRLALDGLSQRLSTRATAFVVGGTLLLTSFGGLAVSDFSAASARGTTPAHRAHVVPPAAAHSAEPSTATTVARTAADTPQTAAQGRAHRPAVRPRNSTRRSIGIIG